jgi:hypothetical protein
VGPCPAERATGLMEKMPHRSDCQIWVESCAKQFQPLVAFGSGPVKLKCMRRLSADSQSGMLVHTVNYYEGVGSWRTTTTTTVPGGGRELCRTSPLMTKERRGGRKRCLSLARAGLSSFLCRLYTMCASLSRLKRGFIHTTTLIVLQVCLNVLDTW